jgi:hypothetical protein
MKVFRDYQGTEIRLTDERLAHILEHPEMQGLEGAVEETLRSPQYVIRSASDDQARLYHRFYLATGTGGKFLCVVVKLTSTDAFVLTAYLTDKVKKGDLLWSAKS